LPRPAGIEVRAGPAALSCKNYKGTRASVATGLYARSAARESTREATDTVGNRMDRGTIAKPGNVSFTPIADAVF